MFENTDKTNLEEIGEFGLIERIKSSVSVTLDSTIKGIGDDAAVIDANGRQTLVSTDLLLEGIHFDLKYVPLKHLGYKAVQVNLSDIYAMNAFASQITFSIGVSSRFPLEAIEEIYQGALLACKKYKVDLVGGDTSSSAQGLVISVTSIGHAPASDVVYRSGAKSGDIICVSGDLGGAYMGLQLLEREKKIFLENPNIQPDLEGKDYIVERQLKPESRKDIIELFRSLGIKPTSMIDVSDGLASDIIHICKASHSGCKLFEDKFPIDTMTFDTALSFGIDPTVCALNGGEDYELLFTLSQQDYKKVDKSTDITAIGYITEAEAGYKLITKSDNEYDLKAQGWNAFT